MTEGMQGQTAQAETEEITYYTGTDGKEYPDKTPKEYGPFGQEHLRYLMKNDPESYQDMVVKGTLTQYLNEVAESAEEDMERLIRAQAAQDGTDENLKRTYPMKWVGLMNNYRHCALEIVRRDWIYC